MKSLILATLSVAAVVSLAPVSHASMLPLNQHMRPALNENTNVRSMINRPPLNTNMALLDVSEVQTKQLALIDDLISKNSAQQTHIQNSTVLSDDQKTTILAHLTEEASTLQSARDAVAAATTFEELKDAMSSVRTLMENRAQFVKDQHTELLRQGQKKAQSMQEKEQQVISRIHAAVSKLQSLGADTTELEAELATHEADVETFHQTTFSSLDDMKTAAAHLRAEVKTMIQTIKTLAASVQSSS